jgi:hypothetical protein
VYTRSTATTAPKTGERREAAATRLATVTTVADKTRITVTRPAR